MSIEWTDAHERAYNALRIAAERIGANNYRTGLYHPVTRALKNGAYKVIRPITITEEHKRVIDAMGSLCQGQITPENAMAILHEYGVSEQRLGKAI